MSTKFCQMVGVDLPIVAFSHCRDVVAAVSRAGGLGVFGAAKFTPEELDIELDWIDAHVDGRPYGVDVLVPLARAERDTQDLEALRKQIPEQHERFVAELGERFHVPPATEGATPRAFSGIIINRRDLDRQIEVALAHPVKFLVSGLGPFPPEVTARARAQNVLIGGLVGSVEHARRHVESGADVIVAQGFEAGGHTGEISTLVLVPQVVDAVAPRPVLAAGGIASGRQLAAVLALGAQGAWMGSAWLTTEESDVDPKVVEKLLQASSNHTLRTRCMTGKPVRMLQTPFEVAWNEPGAPPTLPAPLQGLLVLPLLQRIFQNRIMPVMGQPVGQAVGMLNQRSSCRAVVNDLMDELVDALSRVQVDLDLVDQESK
jgi:NAD(P)H-dependent flavin oxidoreductase YrpB (nitropropane dioxygenase family)